MTEHAQTDNEHSEEEEEIAELYENALSQITEAAREREEKFPKIEALRRYWESEVCGEIDGPKDADWILIAFRIYTRDIQAILDPDEDDPIDDPDEWLEYAYKNSETPGHDTTDTKREGP